MVVLAVLLYCLVPSGCPIGHIVYLWTLTVEITALLVRLPGLEPGASGLGDMFVELPAMSSHILLCISTMLRLLSISPVVQYSQLSEPFITKVIVSKKLAAIFQTAN